MRIIATLILKILSVTSLLAFHCMAFAQTSTVDSTVIIPLDTLVPTEQYSPDIYVNKEHIVKSYTLVLLDLDTKNLEIEDTTNLALTNKVGGVHTVDKTQYQLQFWEHPMHLFGYKTANNIIVIYGLEPQENCEIIKLNEKIYLKYIHLYFELKPSFRYVEFKNVSDPNTLDILHTQNDSLLINSIIPVDTLIQDAVIID